MEFILPTPLEVWKAATLHLISRGGEDYHLRLDFPAEGAHDERPLVDYDPRLRLGPEHDLSRDVANTIFPAKTWRKSSNRSEFYERYLRANARRRHGRWGTYFQRMVSFGDGKINQLERVIAALRSWRNNPKAALQIHLSSAATDSLRPIGAPCLQYIQFSCPNDSTVSLSAIYRNHDYCNKVLGNLFGLSRLLTFVAGETDRQVGRISVLSVHAYFQTSIKNQKRLAQVA